MTIKLKLRGGTTTHGINVTRIIWHCGELNEGATAQVVEIG
jgi:hypothetical protein